MCSWRLRWAWSRPGRRILWNGYHGEIIGDDFETVQGIAGEAAQFPFDDATYIDCGDDDIFNPGTGDFSVSVWFDADPVTPAPNKSQFVVSKGNPGSGSLGWSIWMELGGVFARAHLTDPDTGAAADVPFKLSMNASDVEAGTHHVLLTIDREQELFSGYLDGELMPNEGGGGARTRDILPDGEITIDTPLLVGKRPTPNAPLDGWVDDLQIYDQALTPEDALFLFQNPGRTIGSAGTPVLRAGDANQDLEFNQLDLVMVQIAAKYLTGVAATWGEGDWDGAPGGSPGSPPAGNGVFDQVDIISALSEGIYLTGSYGAMAASGTLGDDQTSVMYDAATGELSVDAPAGQELTSINIDSAVGIFTESAAENLGGSFDPNSPQLKLTAIQRPGPEPPQRGAII